MLNNELVMFTAGSTTGYAEAAMSYFCDKQQNIKNKDILSEAFFAEVERKAGVSRNDVEMGAWMNHPAVKWASFALVDSTINAIIPVTILPQFNLFADFRTVGVGDVEHFTIAPRSFYTVSKSAGERVTLRQRHGNRDLIVTPVEHLISGYDTMYRVLGGKVNVADFLARLILSVENAMYADALSTLNTGLAAITSSTLNVTGAFDMKSLTAMCEEVRARNGGVNPVICGTSTALLNVLPDSTAGWRVNADGANPVINVVRNVAGFDVVVLANAVAGTGMALANNKIYVISPSQDKLVKGVMGISMSNSGDFYETADLTKNFNYRKAWNFVFATASYAGIYTIQ